MDLSCRRYRAHEQYQAAKKRVPRGCGGDAAHGNTRRRIVRFTGASTFCIQSRITASEASSKTAGGTFVVAAASARQATPRIDSVTH